MIQFILKNKEWLFSGIGVTILIVIIALFRKAFGGKKAQVPTEGTTEIVTHLNPSSDAGITNDKELVPIDKIGSITFFKISKMIGNVPPLERDNVKQSFVGIKVAWDTYLRDASKDDKGIVTLSLSPGNEMEDRLFIISCEVALDAYRQLGILPEGARIRIQGEIAKADTFYVKLVNVRLYFLQESISS